MARLRVAVLISGRGTNLQALIDACAEPESPAEIVTVVSNEPAAEGLKRARAAAIPVAVIDHRAFPSRAEFEAALNASVRAARVQLICLAGFMRLLTEPFAREWRDRLINIHPSLLPAFSGLNTHARMIEAGVRFAGCTVHFVRVEMDAGPIIVQAAVPVRQDDTADTLAERTLAAEHRIYPMALRLIAEGRVRVVNEVVHIDGAAPAETVLFNPLEA